MTKEQMFVSKLVLGPSRLVLWGGSLVLLLPLSSRRLTLGSGAAAIQGRSCTAVVHSRQYANFLVCGETIQLQKSGFHIQFHNK